MIARIGFKEAKRLAIEALESGSYQIERRSALSSKNLLATGEVTDAEVVAILKRCSGQHHRRDEHHVRKGVDVHILKRDGWYIKFYILTPDVLFVSVHRDE